MVLAWQIDGDGRYDPGFVAELEIRFARDGEGTRVELEHRNLERYGAKADAVRASLDPDDGWTLEMAGLAKAADGGPAAE